MMMIKTSVLFLILYKIVLLKVEGASIENQTLISTNEFFQCTNYLIIKNEMEFLKTKDNDICSNTDSSKWIRFIDKRNIHICIWFLNDSRCEIYMKSSHSNSKPMHPYETVKGKMCFGKTMKQCYLSIDTMVTNCGSFDLYRLEKQTICNLFHFTTKSTSTTNLERKLNNKSKMTNNLICNVQSRNNDYSIYPLSINDNISTGDVMPYFDWELNQLYILYLKDIWSDTSNERHPWYGLKTDNFYSYSKMPVDELLSCNKDACSQDYALGTGSIIKKDNKYYAFYTGHNPNHPSWCVKKKEGIMLATSPSLNQKFDKDLRFNTIYAPIGQHFDEENDFRDPLVIYDSSLGKYILIASARTLRGVIVYYTSSDLYHWSYQGILYDGDSTYFYMMETPDLFRIGNMYYLLFSDIDSKTVYYRKSESLTGPWIKPTELSDRFDGNGFYGGKVIVDNHGDHYIFAWTNRYHGDSDNGTWEWGGNLIVHKLYQDNTKDLAVTIPHGVQAYLEAFNEPIIKHSQWGIVRSSDTSSYFLSSLLNGEVTNVLFNPINLTRYKISATISFTRSIKDFGFMLNTCDGYNQFYSLRFIPSQHRFSFDRISRSSLETTTLSTTDVPFKLRPNTNYTIDIVIENSMVVTYLDNKVALTTRIYKAVQNSWGIFADNSNANFKNLKVTRP